MGIEIDMSGKVALVTGAASGLGRATAIKLAEAGADLCIVDLNEEGLEETEQMLASSGRQVLVHAADLSDSAACTGAVDAAIAEFSRLDALCNVAGVIFLANSHEMTDERWGLTMAVNLTAPFILSRAAIPHLLESKGAIVNVTSSAAFIGEAYAAAYCATKAGLLNMTKAMAMEYMYQPIRINSVAPGGMATNIAANFRPPEGANIDLIKRFSPMRGVVEVNDVADMVAMLCSPAGNGYHGACVSLDKGITAG
ncbi:SDR family oxidoreductase [Novosphingobium sp. YJ-S2-02]|uniref:SDR family oxidoreductase n=2 Tax=Novosphingobium aureum TaxID=2792964 RepID=A0A931MK40_9SPHN|nr:SDR family oxidoreductase [Novosphingobium aureum]